MIRKVLIGFGVLFLTLVVLFAYGIAYAVYHGSGLDASSKSYVEEATQAVLKDWSVEELRRRASPEFIQVTPDDELKAFFRQLKPIGGLTHAEAPAGEANMFFNLGKGWQITAAYSVIANFENGKALVKLGLVRSGEQWQIRGFRVDDIHAFPHPSADPANAPAPAAPTPASAPTP